MPNSDTLYLGTRGHVCALNRTDGRTLWRTKLTGASLSGDGFVTLLVDGSHIYAHTYGELFCLDAASGSVRWTNPLEGLGYGIASLALPGIAAMPGAVAAKRAQDQASAAVVTTSATTH